MRDNYKRARQILFLLLLGIILYRAFFASPPQLFHEKIQLRKAMDTFFISHGSPTLSIDESLKARHFLQSWQDKVFSRRPTAILVISAHWETAEPTVNAIQGHHPTIHDFYGFPDKMYKLKYPAPGAPELAKRVKELLVAGGFKRVNEDTKRGLDHGAWAPLMLMYPKADIPVCQLSVQPDRDGTYHYNLGKALSPLRGGRRAHLRILKRHPQLAGGRFWSGR